MLTSVLAVVRNGRIELAELAALPEGTRVLVTFLPTEDDQEFWAHAGQPSLDAIWNNPQDDVYAKLLET
jgi:hypothetical protein